MSSIKAKRITKPVAPGLFAESINCSLGKFNLFCLLLCPFNYILLWSEFVTMNIMLYCCLIIICCPFQKNRFFSFCVIRFDPKCIPLMRLNSIHYRLFVHYDGIPITRELLSMFRTPLPYLDLTLLNLRTALD